MKKNNPNGKGDTYRILPEFRDGWDRIFGSSKPDGKLKGSTSQDSNSESQGETVQGKEIQQKPGT